MNDMKLRHYQPAKGFPICGAYDRVRDAVDAGTLPRLSTIKIPSTTDIEKIECPACKRAILRLVREWDVVAAPPRKTEADELATTCFHCGDPAMPSTHGFDPRCERHRDV